MMLLCICCTCFLLWFLYLPCIFTWLFCPCRLPGYEVGGVVVEVFPCRLPAYVAGGVVVETTTRAAVFFLPLCAAFFLFSLWAAVFSWAKLVTIVFCNFIFPMYTCWAHLGLFFSLDLFEQLRFLFASKKVTFFVVWTPPIKILLRITSARSSHSEYDPLSAFPKLETWEASPPTTKWRGLSV